MDVAPGFTTLMVNQMPTPLSPPKTMVRSRKKCVWRSSHCKISGAPSR